MQCANCGAPVVAGQRFCNKCGQPVVASAPPIPVAAPAPPQPAAAFQTSTPGASTEYAGPSRVARHITALAILWIIYSGLHVIPSLALIGLGHMRFPLMMPLPGPLRMFLAPFLGALGVLFAGAAIAGLIAGGGLLARSPWARMLTIVLGCLSLIRFPLGTALGVYTLWVLAPQSSDAAYRSLAKGN